ncbi:LPS assembly protein LptD [Erythrobacter sp. WG]|nr:LPS assembly protein LptD [Erythrobacter sp. WG]MCX9146292.1 LPS assembly protein LptD [Erythrobacter sp. WG]
MDTRSVADPCLRLPAPVPASRLALALALFGIAAPLAAQDAPDQPPAAQDEAPRRIDFEASEIGYNDETQTVTARGQVILRSEDRSVRADEVTWDRKTGQIIATGNIRMVDEVGNQLFTDQVELTEAFDTGAMSELLIALRAGGRLAARSAERSDDGNAVLVEAAYSACPVVDAEGCPREPTWRVTARRVIYEKAESRVRFEGGMLELFGARLIPLPGLSIRTDGGAESGFLVPDVRFTQVNGLELSGEYYWRLRDNADLQLGAYVFSNAAPMASAKWRHLTEKGAYQATGYVTFSDRATDFIGGQTVRSDPRGYLDANGRFQFSPDWSFTGSVRLASDRTFLRRYDISRDDRLRSTVNLERITDRSYFSLAGWATQTLRLAADQGQVPLALPAIDYRQKIGDKVLGGDLMVQANSLALLRRDGQDTRRAFAGAQWDLKRVTPMGQLVTLTALVRGDVYNTENILATATPTYRGTEGWTARGIATAAFDVEWPFAGQAFGGTQVFKPRLQFVASPRIRNLAVPNEDARAIDLEDSNLFALNRFPGYDRVEDGSRITWGVDWQLQRPGWRIKTTVGQSFRLERPRPGLFPEGTGLDEKVTDFVGRTEIRYRNIVSLTHRFRLDKDNLAVRRNEIDATIGTRQTYLELGYLRLNRDIATVEDLRDREELRAAGRVAIGRRWSVFGSGVFNLTSSEEDPIFQPDGFQPIRTRFGVAYADDCIEFGATWRRDFIDAGDARRGNAFQVFFALRNLGFR